LEKLVVAAPQQSSQPHCGVEEQLLSSNAKAKKLEKLTLEKVAPLIHHIRGERVILDSDLAPIYGVTTKRLNEQVKRNSKRFPKDFAFQLTNDEWLNVRSVVTANLSTATNRSQIATGSQKHRDPRLIELEHRVGTHDEAIASIIAAIRGLTDLPKPKSRTIGFRAKSGQSDNQKEQSSRRARTK